MIKLSLKNELRVFFILLFIVPVINIILFNATTSIFSAVIIVVSLLVFFSIAIINLTKIAESLSEFERNSIEGERKHYHFVDLTSSDIHGVYFLDSTSEYMKSRGMGWGVNI